MKKSRFALLLCLALPAFGGMTWQLDPTGSISFTGGIGNSPTISGFEVASFASQSLAAVCLPSCDLSFSLGQLQSFSTGAVDQWNFSGGSFSIQATGGEYLDINGNGVYKSGTDLTGTLVSGSIGSVSLYYVGGTFFFSPDPTITIQALPASIVTDFNLALASEKGSFGLTFEGGSINTTTGAFTSTSVVSGNMSGSPSFIAGVPEPNLSMGAGLAGLGFVLYAIRRKRVRLQ